jgi:diketogulonate reductase-like aldo/keto reductase
VALTASQRAEAAEATADKLGKLPKRQLGKRMGKMMITPVILCQDWAPELYGPAIAQGVNFFHKAGYWNEQPPEVKKLPRESFYCDITVDSTPDHPDDEEMAYRQVTESLRKNGLKYYDIFRAHFGWKNVDALKTQRGTRRAFERLKKEGKVKYYGVSQHDYVPYPEIIAAHIQEGLIDSMQVFWSYETPKETQEIFDKAHRAGIGMTAMKVYAQGGRKMRGDQAMQAKMKAPGMIGRAGLRYALSVKGTDGKPIFDAAVTALRNFEQYEDNMGSFASKVAMADGFSHIA